MSDLDKIVLGISCAISDLEKQIAQLVEFVTKKNKDKVDAQIIFEGKIDVDKIKKIKNMLTDDVGDVIVDEKYDEDKTKK